MAQDVDVSPMYTIGLTIITLVRSSETLVLHLLHVEVIKWGALLNH